ncbi:Disintegrin and metalloproteinase domain-containing protein 33 [Myotis davidii]|uniref:Disintegrin and metalloproteinase domain-containing protein 33 n=1 Tax=Myotis davidii TaxID=225400 RepID=L5M832_MYODS|nr:Disintegrin and metalloproteinase domain-containing protein 33 [Myotis davidii]
MVTLEEPVLKLDTGLVALEAGGQEILLELEKNRGLITLSSNASYYVHPWPAGDAQGAATHRIFWTEQLLSWKGACGHKDPEDKKNMTSLSPATKIRDWREAQRSPKYLELYIVADHALFVTQHRDLNHTKQRLLEMANYVDQILRTLDIQVALTGLEVWTEQDQIRITPDANNTLWTFLRWRRGLWGRRPHDSTQLLTWVPPIPTRVPGWAAPPPRAHHQVTLRSTFRGRAFQGDTVGLAPVEGMCLVESSGGVTADHSELPIGAAATMAHEIGHSLGLSHDPDGCCVGEAAEPGGCVMAAATGGRGYCLDGACPTLEQQCQQLWGPAPEACFHVVNSAGNAHGNCGRDEEGSYVPCTQRDAQCGKLQCQGGEQSPLAPHTMPVDSTLRLDGREVTCRGAFLLPGAQLDLPDLGLVEPGTQCGPTMVCQDRRCQNTTFQELELCLTACHGHGVCNSNHNCHCDPGWAPPSCDQPGAGGSLDSGPVQPEKPNSHLEKPVPCGPTCTQGRWGP